MTYLVVGYIAEWLRTVAKPTFDPHIIQRIDDFDRWCVAQPRGKTAADDILSIEMMALREELLEADELLPLIPRLMSREELVQNKDHLVTWVGADRYDAALRLVDEIR